MKSIIHQPFGDILDTDVGGVLKRPDSDDSFMGDKHVGPFVEDTKMRLQTPAHTITI